MRIALVGVSGVGKTTLMNNLETEFGYNNIIPVPEATKGEICSFSNLPVMDHKMANKNQLAQYDIGRVEYQLKKESSYSVSKQHVVFDKAAPVALMYALTLASRLIPDSIAREFVEEVKLHAKRYYDLLVYIPYNPKFSAKGLERNFTNNRILELQDAALIKVISWLDCPKIEVSATNFTSRLTDVVTRIGVQV